MSLQKQIFFLIIMLTTFIFTSAQNDASVIFEATEGRVSFVSEAPLEIIKASSSDLKGLLRIEDRNFAFIIQTGSFKGFNSPLQQEHFYENYIESKKIPQASFQGKIIEPLELLEAGEHMVRAKGILNIHGVKSERVIKVNLKIEKGKISASSVFDVLLEDHNITIPKMVFQKISEQIKVTVELELKPKI
jgi:hypothetical protein